MCVRENEGEERRWRARVVAEISLRERCEPLLEKPGSFGATGTVTKKVRGANRGNGGREVEREAAVGDGMGSNRTGGLDGRGISSRGRADSGSTVRVRGWRRRFYSHSSMSCRLLLNGDGDARVCRLLQTGGCVGTRRESLTGSAAIRLDSNVQVNGVGREEGGLSKASK